MNRRARSFPVFSFAAGCLVAISLAIVASPALAAQSQPIIVNPLINVFAGGQPALGQVRATSDFNCGIIFRSCRFTYELDTIGVDPPPATVDVRWHKSGTAFDISARMHLFGDHKEWYLDVPNGIFDALPDPAGLTGDVDFSNLSGLLNPNGKAEFYEPPSQPIPVRGILDELNDLGESIFGLDNGLVENPTLASYHSSVERLPAGDYRYSYTVTNGTGGLLTYDWPDAGLSGELEADESATTSMDSPLHPFAVIGVARTSFMGELFGENLLREFTTPTSTIVPLVPEPSSIALLMNCTLLGCWSRRR